MKAAIFNPYLDTLGGGERYTLSFARVLLDEGWSVDLQWRDESIKEKVDKRFGITTDGLKIVGDIKRGSGFDLCFWVSDGSIPLLFARKNILHFQVPFRNVEGRSLLNRMKLIRINSIVCNSKYTKKIIDEEYGVKSVVIYPPVDTQSIKPKRKEKIILYIGRFSQLVQSKRQDILIKAFKKLSKNKMNEGWSLVLAGGVEVGVGDYIKKLEKEAQGYPIEIIKSPDYKIVKDLYGRAKIFWSAAGFGVDEKKNPEKTEHFGITTVEAMSAGAVPVVFEAGGFREIIENGKTGFLWKEEKELISLTKELIRDKSQMSSLSNNALIASKEYGYEKFNLGMLHLVKARK